MKNFMGKDGFLWFIGVVEDRMDPKRLGRLRVRCLGHHTEDKDKIKADFDVVKIDYKYLNRETGLKPIRLKR